VRKVEDIEPAFDAMSRQHVDALVVEIDAVMQANSKLITELAAKHRLPAIYASMARNTASRRIKAWKSAAATCSNGGDRASEPVTLGRQTYRGQH
jgi:hypothetical protein